jgi:hypothetical protein
MTRETKLGLVVAGSFLALVGGVVVARLKHVEMPGDQPQAEAKAVEPEGNAQAAAPATGEKPADATVKASDAPKPADNIPPEPPKQKQDVSSEALARANDQKMPPAPPTDAAPATAPPVDPPAATPKADPPPKLDSAPPVAVTPAPDAVSPNPPVQPLNPPAMDKPATNPTPTPQPAPDLAPPAGLTPPPTEMKPESKPETKPEAKPETKPEPPVNASPTPAPAVAPPADSPTPKPADATPKADPPTMQKQPDPTPVPTTVTPIPEPPAPPPLNKQEAPPVPTVTKQPANETPPAAPPLNPGVTNAGGPSVTKMPEPGVLPSGATLDAPRVPTATAPGRDQFLAAPAVRPVAPPQPTKDSYLEEQYRWKPGDSFANVSSQYYTSPKYADALLKYNQDYPLATREMRQNPPAIAPGSVIWIPPARILERDYPTQLGGLQPIATPTSRPSVEPVGAPPGLANSNRPADMLYRVRSPGESVQEIARRTLGNSFLASRIQGMNPTLSPDPRLPIPPGTVLRLPGEAKVDAADRQ